MSAAVRQIWFGPIENARQARRIMVVCAAAFVVAFFCTYALVLVELAIWGGRPHSTDTSPAWLTGIEWVILLGVPIWLAFGCSRIAATLVLVSSAALTLFLLWATTFEVVRASPESYRHLSFMLLRLSWVLTSVWSLSTMLVSWRAVRAAFAYRRLRAETGPSGLADVFG